MDVNDIYIANLPKALSAKELQELLAKAAQGDTLARDKIIEHNLRLISYRINGQFFTVNYDKKELFSIGVFGLIKAVDTFDISKNIKFATYAIRCIDNEIFMFLRKNKKNLNDLSIETVIYENDKEGDLTVEDTLASDIDLEESYVEKDTSEVIRAIVENLPEREREIISLHFGFYNNQIFMQNEIGKKLNISQSHVSRIIKRVLKEIALKLENLGIYEIGSSPLTRGRQPKPDIVVSESPKLSDIKLTQSSTSSNSSTKKTVPADISSTLPTNHQNTPPIIKPQTKVTILNGQSQSQTVPKPVISKEPHLKKDSEEPSTETPPTPPITKDSTDIAKQTIDFVDYEKLLENLRTQSLVDMVSSYPVKKRIILGLKLGIVNGKYFSSEAIAEYLQIDTQEVIQVTQEALIAYQERINQTIDDTIQILRDNPTKYTKKRQPPKEY